MKKLFLVVFLLGISKSYSQTLYVPSGTGGIGSSSTANVGIGTSSPQYKLHVKGEITAEGDGASGYSDFNLKNGVQRWHISGPRYGEGNRLGIFWNDGTSYFDYLTLTTSGNLGIGTTSPQGKLDINGGSGYALRTLTSSRYVIEVKNTEDTDGGWWLVNDPDGSFALHENSVGDQFTIKPGGNVGIGTTSPDQLLTVNGTIHSKEVKVDLSIPAPDYVFEKGYKLPSLEEIKTYIDQNKHLPEVPSAKEMEANGVQLGEMNMILLKKMEEMTLYMIELKNENGMLKERVEKIENAK